MKPTTTLEAPVAHDVKDRRHTGMQRIIDACEGIADDADAIAEGSLPYPLAYDIARRARMMADELAGFRARDLLSMRQAQS